MNIEEFSKRLGLTREQTQRVKTYWEKAEKSEVKYCKDHDREFYPFEFENMCPVCYEERLWFKFEHGDQNAGDILRRSGRLEY